MNKNQTLQQTSPIMRMKKISKTKVLKNQVRGIGRNISESSNWIWITNKKQIKVKDLDTNHIRSILKSLKPSDLRYNGHSAIEWINAFKTEMTQRNQLADSLLANIFPAFNKKHKEAVKQILQDTTSNNNKHINLSK